MPLYTGVGGVVKEISEIRTGVGGAVKTIDEGNIGISGVNRRFFELTYKVSDISHILIKPQSLGVGQSTSNSTGSVSIFSNLSPPLSNWTLSNIETILNNNNYTNPRAYQFACVCYQQQRLWLVRNNAFITQASTNAEILNNNLSIQGYGITPYFKITLAVYVVMNNGTQIPIKQFIDNSDTTDVSIYCQVGYGDPTRSGYGLHFEHQLFGNTLTTNGYKTSQTNYNFSKYFTLSNILTSDMIIGFGNRILNYGFVYLNWSDVVLNGIKWTIKSTGITQTLYDENLRFDYL